MQRMWGVKKVFSFISFALMFFVLLTACGGGGGGGSDGGGGNNDGGGGGVTVKQGRFIDSSVGGLRYVSGSQSGFTNAQGTFSYDEGAIVQFFIGDIVIGGTAAASIMTPVSLVQGAADETNPTVTNIARFLQTLDDDGNPSNGITITTAVNNLAVGRTINFNQSIVNFGNDPNVLTVVSALTGVTTAGTRPLVSSSSAQNNLRAAILGILSGNYSGTFSGDASGTWTMVIDSSGNINGTAVNSDGSTAAATGTVSSNGTAIMGIVATGATFSGTITITGQVSGTWVDTIANESGTFSGSKQPVTSATLVSIAVTPVNPSIAVSTTQQFTATGTYSDSSTQNITASVTWSSSNTTRATINASGLATALAAGSTTITATSGSISGNTTLTVTSATLVSIAVTPVNPSIAVSTTQQFTATGTYSDSSTQNITASVTWSSSDTTTATINAFGLATALATGSTTIIATSGSISGNTTLTVTSATLVSIAVTPANPSIANGTTQQFTATGTYSDSSTQDITASVTWSSSDTTTAMINAFGLATALAAGSTTITATSGSISGNTTLTVTSGGGPTSVALPKTGQTTSYATGDDGDLERGVAWPSPRFTVDVTGLCVTDNLTGLMWVRTPDSTLRTWATTLTYANDLNLCGYTDWRLPNRKELRSLINYGQANTAAWLNTQSFSNVQANYYWSSSSYADGSAFAWLVNMDDGNVNAGDKTNTKYMWPVRAGGSAPADIPKTGQTISYATGDDGDLERGVAWPSPRFTVDLTGLCVTDNLTGLMWVRTPDIFSQTWANALTYANGLSLCGYDDWRLPNVNELESLINAEKANSAAWLNTQGFSNVVENYYYLSSSTYAVSPADAWVVGMRVGGVFAGAKAYSMYVWPVRAGQ